MIKNGDFDLSTKKAKAFSQYAPSMVWYGLLNNVYQPQFQITNATTATHIADTSIASLKHALPTLHNVESLDILLNGWWWKFEYKNVIKKDQ